ncbi:Glycosyl transferases group 1 [Vibrio sp. B1REV9]|uniref:glycosyltransferase family 4 protein n=1 Tax=Vibrio sp. B1REV9 TaxID=2751179 RepID=UPI001AF41A82|nr:glycosyltransferase family 4 protein [Vibrio sp. B1REV9]CAE6880948.1 Glycosyl transferases group 1 [Vibrio sp. B1REV9]CAE6965119.1 Glycosyl transferases group 1 [Vibrio sp. B1REV9]
MKIIQLITRSDTVGGAQKYILETSDRFQQDGHEVTIVAGGYGVFSKEVERIGLKYIRLDTIVREFSFFNDLKSVFSFRDLVKSLQPEVVVIHSAKAGLVGRLALIGVNTKVIFIAHGWSHIRSSRLFGRKLYSVIENVMSFFCDKVICISKQDLDFANEQLMISKKKTSLIYSGVRDPLTCKKMSCNAEYNLLTVTRFQHPKDFSTLLTAMKEVELVHSNWIITVLGDGDQFEYYMHKTAELGLSGKIKFLGFKEKLGEFYKECDLVFLISKSEGLPLSLIESMSYRKPIIASNVGGVCELIEDGVTGYLVPPSDPKALSQVIVDVLSKTKTELAIMGDNSYEKYRNEFNFEQMINKLYEHFKS